MSRHIAFVLFGVFFFLVSAWPCGAQSFDIIQVADGVYAAIGRPGIASNGAFIVNSEDVLVVDTHLRDRKSVV